MIINPYILGGFDADAAAGIAAAGITDATQRTAANQIILDLKAANIWTKMYVVYLILGGSAASHKWNWKDPQDLDSSFRITFTGGITHSPTGMLGNGTTGRGGTHFNPSIVGTLNNESMSFYSRTNVGTATGAEMGNTNGSKDTTIYASQSNISYYRSQNSSAATSANSDSRGFYCVSRTSSSDFRWQRNASVTTAAVGSAGVGNAEFDILARWNGSNSDSWSNRECAFAHIGQGLTAGEMSALYTAVQAFQTTLGRQV